MGSQWWWLELKSGRITFYRSQQNTASPRVPPSLNTQGREEWEPALDYPKCARRGVGLWNGVNKLNTPLVLTSKCILVPRWYLFDKEIRNGAQRLLIWGKACQNLQFVITSGSGDLLSLFLFWHMCGVSKCYFTTLRGELPSILATSAALWEKYFSLCLIFIGGNTRTHKTFPTDRSVLDFGRNRAYTANNSSFKNF